MKLFSLTIDFAFKALFAPNPDLLISLVNSFPKHILYYWAKIYSRGLTKGQDYEKLQKVYSINFVKDSLWKDEHEYLSSFYLLEKNSTVV